MNHPDYVSEKEYLQAVQEYINNTLPSLTAQKDELDSRVSYALKHMNIDNPEQFNEMTVNLSLLDSQKTKVAQMQYALGKAYFARVDFNPRNGSAVSSPTGCNAGSRASAPETAEQFSQASERHYIGKMTLLDNLKMLIIDWRAPVSSLYYEGRIGKSSYDCPDGTITGDIMLKRQYQINDGKLEGFTDIDITASDEFLQAALGASKDRRLGDIVATIQAEQNKIIRAPLYEPLLVQGAAGSGKTTIALHRIAYLLYTHGDKLKANQVMIMAPSRFFLSYISDVLPDLGVNQVVQTTFAEYVAECLELTKLEVAPSLTALSDAINKGAHYSTRMEAAHLKSSMNFQQVIERYCRHIEEKCVPTTDFAIEGFTIFPQDAVKQMFLETYSYLPVNKRRTEIDKYLNSALKRELPKIIDGIESDYGRRVAECKAAYPEENPERQAIIKDIFGERNALITRIQNKSKTARKQYTKCFQLKNVLEYYQLLFTEHGLLEDMCGGLFDSAAYKLLVSESQFIRTGKRRKSILEPEDLPPLVWMQKRLFGIESDIKHVVIDEAQDLSAFQFIALKAALPRASFSILGDLHQGILAHKGVTNWKELLPIFNAEPLVLAQSYRTTIEIMDTANSVIKQLYTEGCEPDVPLAVPVIRHGDPVERHVVGSTLLPDAICKQISSAQKAGFRSIAIIGRTSDECEALRKTLATLGYDLSIITEQEAPYEGGILILPVYLAKGLEFDVVIITDAAQYTSEALDVKLLYIATTRALHKLVIYSSIAI